MVDSTKEDDWYWIDALQMAMPVFARFGTMYFGYGLLRQNVGPL